ncbi:hypothetical protein [Citricoccus sp. NR2]|uniref:hypothetical protein n=1 Tax=Citricoccus sp. NR2 TaxID=3004095 RepID=UPI0022DD5B41|nr:hypothetical protein [Citricoccus sp. NR2]WBL19994.1 hypothetical protein O1A05_04715 [Citricoccus sp. NR2]
MAKIGEHHDSLTTEQGSRSDPINPGGPAALIAPHTIPRCQQESGIMDKVEQIIEAASLISSRPTVQLGLHRKYSMPG